MIDIAKHITIRLATPESTGSGFYLNDSSLIITAEHIIRDYASIVIEGSNVPRQLAEVVYTDSKLDLALLKASNPFEISNPNIAEDCQEEQAVISYAYPFTEGQLSNSGYIDDESFDFHGHPHIMHDALLSNAANGSALFAEDGSLLGMNSFITWKGRAVGMALPIKVILNSIDEFKLSGFLKATKCTDCSHIVRSDGMTKCGNCRNILDLPDSTSDYSPEGIALTIERLLSSMGYTLELARIGHNHWEVERGSASVNITYYEKNGLIIGDAYICKLPDQSNTALYEYLLRQNYEMENLTFSVKGDDIILSLLIYDRYLNEQTGTELLTNLLEKADHFDNILVEQYQCLWASSRKLT